MLRDLSAASAVPAGAHAASDRLQSSQQRSKIPALLYHRTEMAEAIVAALEKLLGEKV
jgi:hypothetical protein